jgi:hypothetical protein
VSAFFWGTSVPVGFESVTKRDIVTDVTAEA